MVDDIPIAIYSPEKTLVDCFRFRNKIGLNIAIEALKKTFLARKFIVENIEIAAIFSESFYYNKNKMTQWEGFLSQNKLEFAPIQFAEIINKIALFILSLINAIQSNKKFIGHWNRKVWTLPK